MFGFNNNEKKVKKNEDIGHILVSGALDRTKSIRKTAADIFANSEPEKPYKTSQIKMFSGFLLIFPIVSVDLAQTLLNPRTNGWEPYPKMLLDFP